MRMGESVPKRSAAGLPGITHGLSIAVRQMGVPRTAKTLLKVNQVDGGAKRLLSTNDSGGSDHTE